MLSAGIVTVDAGIGTLKLGNKLTIGAYLAFIIDTRT